MSVNAGVAYVDVRPDMQGFSSQLATGTKGAFSKLASLAKLAMGAVVIKQVADFAMDTIHAAEDAAAANRKSFGLIRKDADGAALHFSKLTAWAEKFGDAIGQDDEDITTLASKITTSFDLKKMFGAEGAQAGLRELTKGILDFSAATGKSQTMSTKLFQSIANDPASALTTLLKLGVITEQQADHYKKMVEAGKGAQVSTELLAITEKKYADAAANAATPSMRLAAVWGNFKEVIGGFLLPLFTKFVSGITALIGWFTKLTEGGKGATDMLGGLGDVFGSILDAGKMVWNFFKDDLLAVWDALVDVYNKNLKPALTSLGNAFKKLMPVLAFIVKVYIAFQAIILKVALKALPIIIKVIGLVVQAVAKLIDVFVSVITWVGSKLVPPIKTAWGIVKGIVIGVWKAIKAVWNGATAFFGGIWGGIQAGASAMWSFIKNYVLNPMIRGFNVAIRGLNIVNPFKDIPYIPELAKGGIVTRPTVALLGEAGPEAVVPLSGRGPLTMRVLDWRNGIVQLGEEMDWAGAR